MPWHENHPVARHQTLLAERQKQLPVEMNTMPPETAEAMVVAAIEIIAKHLPPGGITEHEAMNDLIELFDGDRALEIYEAEMNRRNPRDVDSWQ